MGKSNRKKAMKQMQREQAKRDKKFEKPQTDYGIKSLSDYNKQGLGEMFGHNLRSAWYFEKWHEKLIMVVLCILGMWKIVGFF